MIRVKRPYVTDTAKVNTVRKSFLELLKGYVINIQYPSNITLSL